MMQLNKFVFSHGGELLSDSDGKLSRICSQRSVDVQAMLDCVNKDDEFDGSSIFCTVGPFSDAKSWFVCMLDRRESPPDEYGAGVKLLRLFIDLLFPEGAHLQGCGDGEGAEFVLSHPDLDIQNVVVSQDGSLLGLIDWDGVGTVPRCLGNEAYPSWLTRHWDEMKYRYDESAEPGPDCPNNNENSPSELNHYREVYQNIVESISHSPSARKTTANSLLLHNLYIAAVDPVCTHPIVERIFEEIKAGTRSTQPSSPVRDKHDEDDGEDDNYEDFYSYEIFTGLQTGETSDQSLQRLIRRFQALLL